MPKSRVSEVSGGSSVRFEVESAWENSPQVIRRFIDLIPAYQQLCSEVAYTLSKVMAQNRIPVAAVTNRPKELASFLEKIERKRIENPFEEITDFAGTRVVCYYADDIPRVDKIISSTFKVIDREDKSASAGVDRFGYGGVHFLVKLSDSAAGARYDDLKDLVCEIQVRTVMQDAWAILSHHLLYKREEDTPEPLRRSVNALAGALDTADAAFKTIRADRDLYLESVSASLKSKSTESVPINADSIHAFLSATMPTIPYLHDDEDDDHTTDTVQKLLSLGYKDLEDVSMLLSKTEVARQWFSDNHPRGFNDRASLGELRRALYTLHPEVRVPAMAKDFHEAYDEAKKMVSK